jgi:hypothetical protein
MPRFLALALAMTVFAMGAHSDPPTNGDSQATSITFVHRSPFIANRTLADLGFHDSRTAIAKSLACCKICSTGKACGNTCISRNDICHVGPGCACDG